MYCKFVRGGLTNVSVCDILEYSRLGNKFQARYEKEFLERDFFTSL